MNTVPAPSRILLGDANDFPLPEEEAEFFTSLHQSDGTTKMTSRDRLTDVNAAVVHHLPVGSPLEALDVGISSGVSTLEWLVSLETSGRKCSMTAFDRVLQARLYRFGRIELLTEAGDHTLLIHTGKHAYTRPTRRVAHWRNWVVRGVFRASDMFAWLCRGVGAGSTVRLASTRLRARPDIRLVEHDIFNPLPDWSSRFHLVRVANLLNRSYFPETALRIGMRNASDWVRQGGLLVVARTDPDGRNHATMFRRDKDGLRIICRLGSGSEVESLAMSPAS